MRQLTAYIRSEHNEWTEVYREGERGSFPVGEPDPDVWIHALVTEFNNGLRTGESPRHVVKTEVVPYNGEVKIEHRWEKTNLVTIVKGMRMYDTARCAVCGVTAKRYGLGGYERDAKFRSAKYETCIAR